MRAAQGLGPVRELTILERDASPGLGTRVSKAAKVPGLAAPQIILARKFGTLAWRRGKHNRG